MQLAFSFILLIPFKSPDHEMLLHMFKMCLPRSISLEICLQTHQELCLLGNYKPSQGDNTNYISQCPLKFVHWKVNHQDHMLVIFGIGTLGGDYEWKELGG